MIGLIYGKSKHTWLFQEKRVGSLFAMDNFVLLNFHVLDLFYIWKWYDTEFGYLISGV